MSTLIQYEPFVDNTTQLFLSQTDKLYATPNKSCNFSRWLQFYAFDVIGEMTYSKRHGFIEEDRDIDGIIGYIANLFDYVAPVRKSLPYPFINPTTNPELMILIDWANPHSRSFNYEKPPLSPCV